MANVRKRISELTALNSASLDTTIVGVHNGTTYKIELDTLADAVTSRVNILDRDRLSSLESVTSSFETKGNGILSGSVSYTSLTNIPQGIVSQSTDLGSLNTFTQSINSRVDNLESNTGSYLTSLDGAISSSSQLTSSYDERYILSGSITETTWDNIANKPGGIVSQSTDLSSLNLFTQSAEQRIGSLESNTGSYLTSLNGAISSSSQLTASYDSRYVLSGSITQTTWDNIANKPAGIVSSSVQILGGSGIISSSANLVTTSSYNADSASFDTRINSITVSSGSNLTYLLEAYANVTYTLPGTFTEDICRYSVVSATENVPSNWFNTSTYRFTPQKAGYWEINAAYDVYRNTEASMAIRKNGSIVASAGSFNAVAQDISKIIYLNGSTDYIDIVNTGGAALQRNQYQQRSWFQAKFVGNIDGSTDLLTTNNTFTGNNTFNGTTRFETVGGDEGGEIEFGVPQTNTSLSTRVVADVYQNRLRIFDGNTKGVFIDLSKAPIGVAGEIAWKTSGLVNAGTFLTLDNLKVTCTTSGARGLSVGAVSTNFTANIAGWFGFSGGGGGASANNVTYTTTAAGSAFGWGFNTEGDASNYIITDKTNSRVYRVTLMIGFGFNNNFISIERLH